MNKELTPKQKGLNTQLHCISYFSDCGFLVSTPYGDNGRYDLIVDINGHLLRVQVKTASLHYDTDNEACGIKFSCKSAKINTKESYTKRYSKEEIDYFATYWNYKAYVVPVEETSSQKILRFYETKNNQDDMASFLEDYTIEKQWSKFLSNLDEKIEEPILNNQIIEYKKENNATKYFCKRCGKEISYKAEHCPQCYQYLLRKVDRPDRKKLKELIRDIPFTQIAKEYGVSDKAVSKWCKAANLPSTKRDIKAISDEDWKLI